jgi:hypothetical protein
MMSRLKNSLTASTIQKKHRAAHDKNSYFLLRSIHIAKVFAVGLLAIISIRILISSVTGDYILPNSAFESVPPFELTTTAQLGIGRFYLLHDILMSTQPMEAISYLRAPILLGFGILLPLAVFIFNWNSRIFIRACNPYFLLVGAHAVTLFIAGRLLGPGSMTFVGIAYSSLRSMQMTSLLKRLSSLIPGTTPQGHTRRCPPTLLWGARFEWLLWTLNALYLTLYVVLVTVGLFGLGLEWRWQ